MGFAVLAPKDLVGIDIGVVGEAHRGWGFCFEHRRQL
jgi:hypothetical protein